MPCVVVEGNQHGLLEFLRASFDLYYNVCSEKLFAFWFFFIFFIFYFYFLPGSNSLFTNYSESTRLKMSSLPVGELTASCLIVEEVKKTRR